MKSRWPSEPEGWLLPQRLSAHRGALNCVKPQLGSWQQLEALHEAAAQRAQRGAAAAAAPAAAAALLCCTQVLGTIQAQAVAAGSDSHLQAVVQADGAACRGGMM